MRKLLPNGLTQQQENFIQKYIECGIAYQAYIYAYPKAKNWTRNAVDVQANKLLNNSKVNLRLAEHNKKIESTLAESLTLNKRKILEEIVNQYQETAANGAAERTNSVNLLKLLAQISKLIGDNQPAVNVNIINNQITAEVSDYLNL